MGFKNMLMVCLVGVILFISFVFIIELLISGAEKIHDVSLNKDTVKWDCKTLSMNGTYYDRCVHKDEICIVYRYGKFSCFKEVK